MILTWNLDQYLTLTRTTKKAFKKLAVTSCQQIVTSLSIFQFMTNLEQSGSRTQDAQSVKLKFSLILTFYLAKIADRTKTSLTELPHYSFEKGYYFCQKTMYFWEINAYISKVNGALVLKGIFSEAKYVCVITYKISSF